MPTTAAQLAAGLKVSDVAKAEKSQDMSREGVAKRAVQTTNRLYGGDPNIRAYGEKFTPGSGGYAAPATNDNYASVTAPTTPIPEAPVSPALQPPAPIAGTPSPQEALKTAQASGIPAPQTGGEARSEVQKYQSAVGAGFYKLPNDTNPAQVYNAKGEKLSYDQYIAQGGKADFSNVQQGLPDTTTVDQQLAQDPNFAKILQDQKEYTDVVNQQKSLTETYTQLTKQLGIPALNTQLMNMKNVIDGTENDIRQEVTKAGGFATDSQVMALSSARNKTLIQNYNNLLNVKQQAQDTLNTMLGLAEKDKSLALQSITQKLGIDSQIYEFSQKATNNAQNAYQGIIDKVGYAGLYAMTGGNDFYAGMIEKTLGLPLGGLSKLAGGGSTGATKFETVTIGSGKGNIKVRYGYDSSGNIVSATNLNTGQPYGGYGGTSTPTRTSTPSITPRGTQYPTPTTSAIKSIIAAHPNEWGHAADAIDAKYGAGTATKYNDLLTATYAKSTTIKSPTSSSSFDNL